MINRHIIIVFILLIQSCVNKENSINNYKEDIEELSILPFTKITKCYDITASFFESWHKNGGKLEDSILKMRKHIENDNKSEFAILVKSAWKTQENLGFYEKNIGSWPISDDKLNIVLDSFLFSNKNNLGECGALAMWDEFMSEEFTLDKNDIMVPRLLEFPSSIEWVYPDNMLWLKFWIFVNIHNNTVGK